MLPRWRSSASRSDSTLDGERVRRTSAYASVTSSGMVPSMRRERTGPVSPSVEDGDLEALGLLLVAGHASCRDLYEVSCPELDLLVKLAEKAPGCMGARMTGAGLGGNTINLVERDAVERFVERMTEGYRERTGREPGVVLTEPAAGAR